MRDHTHKRYARLVREILAALALLPAVLFAHGETALEFNVYPMPGGAPVASVNGMVVDGEGAVWIVTWGEGLHRIHGTAWNSYTEAEGLPDDWIRAIDRSTGGGVWVGTGEGLALVRDDRVHAITPENLDLLADGDITCVRELSTGQILAGTMGGTILLRDPVGTLPDDLLKGWRPISGRETSSGHELTGVLEMGPDEQLLSLAWGGLGWLRGGAWTPDPTLADLRYYALHEEFKHDGREIWAVERDGGQSYRHTPGGWVPMERFPANVHSILTLDSGELMAATHGGLFFRDSSGWRPWALDPSLGEPELRSVIATRDGAVWAGGREGLIRGTAPTWLASRQPGGPTVLLPSAQPNDPTRAMNFDGKVFAPEGTGWVPQCTLNPWPRASRTLDNSIWMGDGRLWNESAGGLRWVMIANDMLHTIYRGEWNVYSLETGERTELRTLPRTDATLERFLVTAGGSLLYMAAEGAYRLEEGAWTPFPTAPGYQQKHVFSLVETEPGIFWAGVDGGIERWAGESIRFFGEADGISPEDDIHAIAQSRTGDLWFGSMGAGLYRYNGNRFEQFTKADGLRSNSVRAIRESADGAIWIADRGTGVSALRGGRWVHYGLEHGLPHAPALTIAESFEGVLWIGSQAQGLFRFRPDKEAPDTEIIVGPTQIDSHGIGVFSFAGRDAWNQTPIRDLHYAWRVPPSDGDRDSAWSPFSTDTTVVTGELEHGHYRFEVRSSDENGNVDPTPATMEFEVLPPLWMKPGFVLPVSLSIVLAAVALVFQWVSRKALLRSEAALRSEVEIRKRTEALLERHSENLEELVEERTRVLAQVQEELIRKERLATLGQLTATVSHELRNPLGTIQSSLFMIEKRVRGTGLNLESALDRTARSVKRCDKIIEELLDFTRTSELFPQPTPVDPWLREAFDDIGTPEGTRLDLRLNCPTSIRIDRELMRRVLINLLDNAVQAMNEAESPERAIVVRSLERDGRAEIYMEDTGPGIPEEVLDRIFEPLFSTKNFGIGLGTNIMRNIMMRHNGGIEYANREDTQGTRVLIWLPSSVDS